jgi:hypothetical protein
MTYSQATSTQSIPNNTDPQYKVNSINSNMMQLTILNPKNNNVNENQSIQPAANSIILFIDTSTMDESTSAMTTDDHGRSTFLQSNLIVEIFDQKNCEIKSVI